MRRRSPNVLVLILAGGQGSRLFPLTRDRAKPAVPFGGTYRLIDFVVSNFANAGHLKMVVLTQYKSHSLERHLTRTWAFPGQLGLYVKPVAAQMRHGPHWYMGSADAVYQNLHLIDAEDPDVVCVFGADHVYRMDPTQMIEHHLASGAGVTVAAAPVPVAEASAFGVIESDDNGVVRSFVEKPDEPAPCPGRAGHALASMGNYVFDPSVLRDALERDARTAVSKRDFGGDVLPALAEQSMVSVYDYARNTIEGEPEHARGYWRDVGTIDSYYDASMDLVAPMPRFNLYLDSWPIHTAPHLRPPAKTIAGPSGDAGLSFDSLLCPGAIVSGGRVSRSIIGPDVYVDEGAMVEQSIILGDTHIGAGSVIRGCIVDRGARIPPHTHVGVDRDADSRRFVISPAGVRVIPRRYQFTETVPDLPRATAVAPVSCDAQRVVACEQRRDDLAARR